MRLPTLDTVWLILPLAGVILAASLEPLPPHDFWWHLVMGRELASGSFPATNQFLYTMPVDAPFHDQPWLAQWIMFHVHDVGGVVGGMVFRSVLLLSAWAVLMYAAVRRSTARVAGGLALVAVLVSYPVLTYRTRLFAFLPFVILIVTLLDERRSRWAPIWLFAATAWWANVHGTFVLAPALVFGSAGAVALQALAQGELKATLLQEGRWWGAVLVSVVAGALVTPHGLENLTYVLNLAVTSNVSSTVSEWLPPDLGTPIGLAWAIAFVASIGLLVWSRKNASVLEVALFLATTYLAASAIRSVFWWAAVAVLVCAPHAAALIPRSQDEDQGNVLNLVIVLAIVGFTVALHPGVAPSGLRVDVGGGRLASSGPGAGILSSGTGLAEVEFGLERAGEGRVFHDQALGGVVEWVAGPRRGAVAFVDQRMELIPESVWESYFAISSGDGWQRSFDEHAVSVAILSIEDQWPLVQALDASPAWTLERVGQAHWVFARRELFDRAQNPAK